VYHRNRHGTHIFNCDECSTGFSEHPDDRPFDEVWEELREKGWRARKGGDGKWEHTCPDC
jgi:hypothetical protein